MSETQQTESAAPGSKKKTAKKKAARQPVEYRDDAHRFQVLGKKRATKAVKQIRLIGNLSGSGYVSTDEQVAKLFATLQDELDAAKARFDKKQRKGTDFEF